MKVKEEYKINLYSSFFKDELYIVFYKIIYGSVICTNFILQYSRDLEICKLRNCQYFM